MEKRNKIHKATITLTIAAAVFVALCAAFWWINTHYPLLGMAIVTASCWAAIYKMFYSEQPHNTDEQ